MGLQRGRPAPGPQAAQIALGLNKVKNVEQLPLEYLDLDTQLSADSNDKVPSQKAIKRYVDDRQLPVGFVFISVVATNPAELLGYGTWAIFAEGEVLVGYKAGDPDFDTPGASVGAKTKAISAHAGTAVANHADHDHVFIQNSSAVTPDLLAVDLTGAGVAASGTTQGASVVLNHAVTQPNNHTDLNVVQPSRVVYFWQRTA